MFSNAIRAKAREAIRARQILVDLNKQQKTTTDNGAVIAETTLIERANTALKEIIPDNFAGSKFTAALRLRNGGILFEMNRADTVSWLRKSPNRENFADSFKPACKIKERQYTVIVPFVPLTFNPENKIHLRETEEANDLQERDIARAQWIKPPSQREKKQTVGHLMLTFANPETANKALTEGIQICNK